MEKSRKSAGKKHSPTTGELLKEKGRRIRLGLSEETTCTGGGTEGGGGRRGKRTGVHPVSKKGSTKRGDTAKRKRKTCWQKGRIGGERKRAQDRGPGGLFPAKALEEK